MSTETVKSSVENVLDTYAQYAENGQWEPLLAWFRSHSPGGQHAMIGLAMLQMTGALRGQSLERDAWAMAFAVHYRNEMDLTTTLVDLVDPLVMATIRIVHQDDRLRRSFDMKRRRDAPRWHNLRGNRG